MKIKELLLHYFVNLSWSESTESWSAAPLLSVTWRTSCIGAVDGLPLRVLVGLQPQEVRPLQCQCVGQLLENKGSCVTVLPQEPAKIP